MKYLMVMLSGEYAREKGKFGIVAPNKSFESYFLKDGKSFPIDECKGVELIWAGSPNKVTADYQLTLHFGRAISQKLKNILGKFCTSDVYFFPILLVDENGQKEQYYILHFNKILDVIDPNNLYLTSPLPMVLIDKLVGVDVFNIDEGFGRSFCVSERVRIEMEKANITGCTYAAISKE